LTHSPPLFSYYLTALSHSSRLVMRLFLFFFFFMIPQHPRSTLFPYTTLFRSCCLTRYEDLIRAGELRAHGFYYFVPGMLKYFSIDRKSTRLNSSHLVISYAVFCLKKKTENPSTIRLFSKTYPCIRHS